MNRFGEGEGAGGDAVKRNGICWRNRIFMAVGVRCFLYAPIFVLIVFSFNDRQQQRRVEGLHPALVRAAVPEPHSLLQRLYDHAAGIRLGHAHRHRGGHRCGHWLWPACGGGATAPVLGVNNIPLTNADIVTGVSMMSAVRGLCRSAAGRPSAGWLNSMAGMDKPSGCEENILSGLRHTAASPTSPSTSPTLS